MNRNTFLSPGIGIYGDPKDRMSFDDFEYRILPTLKDWYDHLFAIDSLEHMNLYANFFDWAKCYIYKKDRDWYANGHESTIRKIRSRSYLVYLRYCYRNNTLAQTDDFLFAFQEYSSS